MLKPKEIWFLRAVALLCLVGGLQILLLGEVGAPSTDATYQFRGFERLFAIWPFLLAWFFWWCSKPSKEDSDEPDES